MGRLDRWAFMLATAVIIVIALGGAAYLITNLSVCVR